MLNKWQCTLVGLWDFLKTGTRISGCAFEEQEFHKNVDVVICKCSRCGKQDISWGKNLK